jgi:hypothetical protein
MSNSLHQSPMRYARIVPIMIVACWMSAAVSWVSAQGNRSDSPQFDRDIAPLLNRYCISCHNADDREGGLAVDTFPHLAAGGESGPAVLPSDVEGSHLWRLINGIDEPAMPPDDMQGPSPQELEVIAKWIKAGAPGPQGESPRPMKLVVPELPPAEVAALPISAIAWSPVAPRIAIGRFQRIDIHDANTGKILHSLTDLPGKVNALHFSANGQSLLSASGVTGLYGQADLWSIENGECLKSFRGHRDTLYAAALSPDFQQVATASYDGKIILWSMELGTPIQSLSGHNGSVFDLHFSPTEPKLVSASADQTLKIWSLENGQRLDTLGQPLKEQFTGRFSPDGQFIVGGGGDNRLRLWEAVDGLEAKINPLAYSRYAHEGPIVAAEYSPDGQWIVSAAEDRSVKLWRSQGLQEAFLFPVQQDVVTGVAFAPDNQRFALGRMDGTWEIVEVPEDLGTSDHQPQTNTEQVVIAAPNDLKEIPEREPNNHAGEAQAISLPARIQGKLHDAENPEDDDLFRFNARKGEQWIIEINAQRQGSPVDSHIQILDAEGELVPRVLLQAVRDSYFTFRGKDSSTSGDFRVHNWEEMELNELLYCNGEVVKLWLYPRGPDSGFKVYPGAGSRYTYFDTTATTHALGEPCYIVEPYPIGTQLIPNGLPVFTVHYENDDDAKRQLGTDSRLLFTAPDTGDYILKVSDTRGFSGESSKYTAEIRPRRPNFEVSLGGANPKVSPGGAREFSVKANRLDDFDGEIQVTVDGLPDGFHATSPIIIEAGQNEALGVIWADSNATAPAEDIASLSVVRASAEIQGQTVEHEVNNLGKIELAPEAKTLVRIVPASGNVSSVDGRVVENPPEPTPWPNDEPVELVIEAGSTIAARVLIQRNELEGRIPFGNEDSGRNLPHGVIVDNIGLNGLLIIEDQQERVFFLTAAKWVKPQSRLFHLQAKVDGNQCSLPVLLHIVEPGDRVAEGALQGP